MLPKERLQPQGVQSHLSRMQHLSQREAHRERRQLMANLGMESNSQVLEVGLVHQPRHQGVDQGPLVLRGKLREKVVTVSMNNNFSRTFSNNIEDIGLHTVHCFRLNLPRRGIHSFIRGGTTS